MMLCSVPGFLPAIRAAMRARHDIPRAAFVLAARHEHPSFAARRVPLTADEVVGIAQHFRCVAWLKGRVRNA